MLRKKLITEEYSDEVDLFKLAASYYKKHGMERTKKVLIKIMDTLDKRETPTRAPKDVFPGKHYIEELKKKDINKKTESKEGGGAYDAPAFPMKPDHVHFKNVKKRF